MDPLADRYPAPITDPASVLIGLGALCGLLAVKYWWGVARGASKLHLPDGRKARANLAIAAFLTAACLGLSGAGYLIGRFTGRF